MKSTGSDDEDDIELKQFKVLVDLSSEKRLQGPDILISRLFYWAMEPLGKPVLRTGIGMCKLIKTATITLTNAVTHRTDFRMETFLKITNRPWASIFLSENLN